MIFYSTMHPIILFILFIFTVALGYLIEKSVRDEKDADDKAE